MGRGALEVRLVARLALVGVAARRRLVFAVVAVGVTVTPPAHRNAAPVGTFELKPVRTLSHTD